MKNNEKKEMNDMCICRWKASDDSLAELVNVIANRPKPIVPNVFVKSFSLYSAIYNSDAYDDNFSRWWGGHIFNLNLTANVDYLIGYFTFSLANSNVDYSDIMTLDAAIRICDAEETIATIQKDAERLERIRDIKQKITRGNSACKAMRDLSEKLKVFAEKEIPSIDEMAKVMGVGE